MKDIDLTTITLGETIAALDRGAFSTLELVRSMLLRARETEPDLHAYVEVYEDDAVQHALIADRARAYHRARRPLLGLPIGIKDIFDIAGKPTRCNSRQRDGVKPANRDAEVVHRLRRDGAILIGKTVTQEYAAGVVSEPCRNPWDLDRIPGGSSGGSAAAVALGTALGALGSDTGGSIRIPAALTGTVGFKPTFGRLETAGVFPLSPALDTVGPIARSVADCVILYLSMANRTAEIASVEMMLQTGHAAKPLDGVRIGVLGPYFTDNLQPDIATSFAEAVATLRTLGASIVEVAWNHAPVARAVALLISRIESSAIHHHNIRTDPGLIRDDIRARFEIGALLPGDVLIRGNAARTIVRDSIAALYREHALAAIVTPTVVATAPLAAHLEVAFPDGSTEGVGPALTRLTMPWNATGQPVVAVPCGFDRDELPIGLSFIGRPDDDLALCRIAHQYEAATGWFRQQVKTLSA